MDNFAVVLGMPVVKKITAWVRTHIFTAVLAALLTGALGAGGALWVYFQSRIDRIEGMKVEEFQSLMTESRQFLETLSVFTEQVAETGLVDNEKKKELSASLVRLYSGYGLFVGNLPRDKVRPIRDLQHSINEMRKTLQLMKEKEDLDPLSVAFHRYIQHMKIAQPILEEAVGKNSLSTT